MEQLLRDVLLSLGRFEEEEIQALEQVAKYRSVTARAHLFSGDRVFDKLIFLEKGIIRSYRIIDGEDFTYYFFFPKEFVVDFQSFLTQTPSDFFFEALSDAAYLIFEKSDIYKLYDAFPRFEKIGRLMAENAYLSAASRLKEYQTEDLETRYKNLLAKNPELIQAVPQHYIASYLGVKPQSLSRIKAQMQGKKY